LRQIQLIMLLIISLFFSTPSIAQETIRIAVASNFLATLKALSTEFTAQTGIRVSLSNGATGMLYAQIKRGAPYDMFFSADEARPELLEKQGLIVPGSRFTYVTGRLVVWSPKPDKVSPDLSKLDINNPNLYYFAMANPKTAPYGIAGKTVLEHYGVYKTLSANNKIALGENIGKTYHYVASQNAQLGLIAKSYVANPKRPMGGQYIEIPLELYPTLKQQAVILKGKQSSTVNQFLTFFHSKKAQQRIADYGYGLVEK